MAKTTTTEQTDEKPDAPIKFLGMSAALASPPGPGDVQKFVVTARCVGYGADERAQGGWTQFRKMRVLEVVPGELTKAPDSDPPLPFDEDDDLSEGQVDDEPAGDA